MGFSRQEYWSELLFPFPGDLPDPGINPGSPASQADPLPSESPGRPLERKHSPKAAGWEAGRQDPAGAPGDSGSWTEQGGQEGRPGHSDKGDQSARARPPSCRVNSPGSGPCSSCSSPGPRTLAAPPPPAERRLCQEAHPETPRLHVGLHPVTQPFSFSAQSTMCSTSTFSGFCSTRLCWILGIQR